MSDIVKIAQEFAYNKHNVPQECKRYGNAPYSVHLENVVEYAKKYSHYLHEDDVDDVMAAAYLHDLIEDTPANLKIIKRTFNEKIATIIFAVTNERGEDRKDINFKTYPKIWKNDLAIFVKLCDRLSNTKTSKETGHRMYEVYTKEYPLFRYSLKIKGLYPDMWNELDELNNYKEIKIK